MIGQQFTPGPWSVGPAHVVAQRITDDAGRRVTRFVAEACLSAPLVEGEREANGRLIAAAPELYEVAQLYLDWGHLSPAQLEAKYPEWDRAEGVRFIDAKARAVIAKARGES